MKILNASRRTINIMMDNGALLTIAPGQLSTTFVATTNSILATINSGSPSEIGIILGGTYEQSIAQRITGAQPYIYLSELEAKAKLIDPTVDYSKDVNSNQMDSFRAEITKLQKDIELKDREIGTLKENLKIAEDKIVNLESDESTNLRLKNYAAQLDQSRVDMAKLKSELDGQNSNVANLTNQLGTMKAERDALKSQLEIAQIKIKDQGTELEKYADQSSQVMKLQEQLDKFKAALEASEKTVSDQRTLFNKACEKFGLALDEKGEWVMNKPAGTDVTPMDE